MNSRVLKTTLLFFVVTCIFFVYKWFIYTPTDQFANIQLNDVSLPANRSSTLTKELNSYDCYFNPNTVTNLSYGSALAEQLLSRNQIKSQEKLSSMYKQIDVSLDQLNYDLLTQIQKNYYDAHVLNVEREANKTRLSQLPLRNL